MTQPLEVNWSVIDKQHAFIVADYPECEYSGAWGAGKSRGLCMKTVARASIPGAREGLCRSTNVALRDTTLRTLLEPEGDLPPVLPAFMIETHDKSKQRIKIKGGGEIVYFGIRDPQQASKGGQSKHGSLNLTGVNIDESVELTESEYFWIKSRVRMNVKGVTRQVNGATNPGPPSHFLAKRFGLALDYKAEPGCWAIKTGAADNPFLPPDVIESYNSLTGLMHRRYVLGEWCGSDGLVFDLWDRQRHVRHEPVSETVRVFGGVDEGYTDPFAVVRAEIDGDGRIWVSREVYKTQLQREEKIKLVDEVCGDADEILVDSAAPELIQALRVAGLPARKCKKGPSSIVQGIMSVSQRLVACDDGHPRLTVSPDCSNLIREFESYEWLEGKDKPKGGNDHALDALRYLVMRLDRNTRAAVKLSGAPEPETVEPAGNTYERLRQDPNFGF